MIAIRRGVVFPFGCRYDAIIGRSKTRTRIAAARIRAAARREATAATFIADLSSHASVRRLATEVLARYPMSIRCERRRNSSILFRHAFVLLMALTACSFCARNKALLDGIRDLDEHDRDCASGLLDDRQVGRGAARITSGPDRSIAPPRSVRVRHRRRSSEHRCGLINMLGIYRWLIWKGKA